MAKVIFPFQKIIENLKSGDTSVTEDFPRSNIDSYINESTRQLYQQRLDEKIIDIQNHSNTEIDNIIKNLWETKKMRPSNQIW